jgi:hypothetical protein
VPVEIRAILITLVLAPVFVLVHIVLCRLHDENRTGAKTILLAALLYAAGWLLAAFAIRGRQLTPAEGIAGLSAAGFIVLAWTQVYSQIARGFSLRILVDIDRLGGLSIEGILQEYSDGRGAAWLVEKRISGLEEAGLARRRGETLELAQPRGAWAARAGRLLKGILKPGQDG